jgi:hypothetical protein
MSKRVRSVALPIIGSIVGNTLLPGIGAPIGAAVASGANNYSQTHNLGTALKSGALSGAGSYVGGQIGGSIGGGGGTVANAFQSTLGPDLGSAVGQLAGGTTYLSPLNAVLGSAVGSNLASSLVPQKTANPKGATPSTAFSAKREAEQSIPSGFRSLGSLTPDQLSTNIATGGVYGGGQGPDEDSYFLNMINRRLVTDEGQVDSDLSDIKPIESSYLAQLGLGGYSNANTLLEAISKYRAAA